MLKFTLTKFNKCCQSIIHSLRMLTKVVSKWNFIVKCYPDILYCNNISQYFWSSNCSLGEHKTSFKNIKKYNLKLFNWSVCTHTYTHRIFVYNKQVMVVSHSGWMWCRLKTQAYIQYTVYVSPSGSVERKGI